MRTYTVVSGDTLSRIALRFYGNANLWSIIYYANRDIIRDPNLIFPGQVLKIPDPQTSTTTTPEPQTGSTTPAPPIPPPNIGGVVKPEENDLLKYWWVFAIIIYLVITNKN
jgi:LysM repeat protein